MMKKVVKTLWMGLLTAGILSNPMLSYPGRDSGIFLYIGSLILKGKIPYRDVWENKGPLVFYLNALGLFLTGGSRWGIWLLEFIFLFAASAVGYTVIKRTMGEIPAIIGTFVWVAAAGNVLQGGNFSEEYSLLFSFMAFLFYLKSNDDMSLRRAEIASSGYRPPRNDEFIIGATLGLNILLRPNNISAQVAIAGAYFVLALLSKDWRLLAHRAVQILLGALVVVIPALVYFSARNALTEMIDVVIIFNAQYSEGGGLSRIVEGIVNAARGIGFLWIAIALLGYISALISSFKRDTLSTPQGKFLLVLVIGLPLEAVLSGLSGRNYLHYFIGWSPYIGLLCGYAVYILLNRFTQNAEKFSMPLMMILAAFAVFAHFDAWKNYGAVVSRAANHAQVEYRD
ncbi:MAG: glycosyltransferase family 39 protein, partial [Anaerolineales bacterium]|nr:glycosyltransferase family 39 protein [Anaerolineales bacterium]